MKSTNIRELKHSTSVVLGWVAEGESVQITRRDQVVGIIVPPLAAEVNPAVKPPPPADFYQRLEALFHDRKRPMTGTELVSYARGER
jgi:antitoxin (DNA-binding transcriptional repressor) of toxin-antitoxin stability system